MGKTKIIVMFATYWGIVDDDGLVHDIWGVPHLFTTKKQAQEQCDRDAGETPIKLKLTIEEV